MSCSACFLGVHPAKTQLKTKYKMPNPGTPMAMNLPAKNLTLERPKEIRFPAKSAT
jgi:hypothetical protein